MPRSTFCINRFGLRFDEITASSLVKVDLEGNVVDGPEDLNVTGFVIHSAVHAAREDVVCVMHSHGPGGLAVSALADGFIPMTQDGFMFYERVAYHDYEGLSTDTSECQRLAANLGDKDVMVLRNHGLLTVGSSVGEAFMRMYYLERACQTQMKILASGAKTELPPVARSENTRADNTHSSRRASTSGRRCCECSMSRAPGIASESGPLIQSTDVIWLPKRHCRI